jgi:hypothetical protein
MRGDSVREHRINEAMLTKSKPGATLCTECLAADQEPDSCGSHTKRNRRDIWRYRGGCETGD